MVIIMKITRQQRKEIIELLKVIGVTFIAFRYFLMSIRISGKSMMPTHVDGERGIMFRKTPFNLIKYNDVVVVKLSVEKSLLIKRVIGLPNDTIEIKDNAVYVNDRKITDKYRMIDSYLKKHSKVSLKDDEYFVLGDNRENSKDSRVFGAIKGDNIIAVNGIIYYPLAKIGLTK